MAPPEQPTAPPTRSGCGKICAVAIVAAVTAWWAWTHQHRPASSPIAGVPSPAPTHPSTAAFATPPKTLTDEEAHAAAVARFPDLAVEGSALNQAFLARFQKLKVDEPAYFQSPDWQLRLAAECAEELKAKR